MRGITRTVGVALAIVFAAACGGASTPAASQPAASAKASAPKFELSTYQYAIQTKGKLRIGSQEDNPPFSVKNPATGKWEGFDADFGRELAKAIFGPQDDIDKFIEWVPVVSATRIPSLTDNKADVIIKTFTITEERTQQIECSAVYFVTGQRILVKKDNTRSEERRVGKEWRTRGTQEP